MEIPRRATSGSAASVGHIDGIAAAESKSRRGRLRPLAILGKPADLAVLEAAVAGAART